MGNNIESPQSTILNADNIIDNMNIDHIDIEYSDIINGDGIE